MRYSEYLRNLSRLEKSIAGCRKTETKLEARGDGLLSRLFPRIHSSKMAAIRNKRTALCLERDRLVYGYFGKVVQNVNMWTANARGIATSSYAVGFFKSAAEAAVRNRSER